MQSQFTLNSFHFKIYFKIYSSSVTLKFGCFTLTKISPYKWITENLPAAFNNPRLDSENFLVTASSGTMLGGAECETRTHTSWVTTFSTLPVYQFPAIPHYSWWRISDSNRSPEPCKDPALPNELIPQ